MSSIDPPLASVGGIHTGNVEGNLTFHALGDIVGGDKIVTINTSIQISVDVITQHRLLPVSPYRGLERFETTDQALFFGRDQLIKRLLSELSTSNVLLVLGASGSGKSSVIRAGLLPMLKVLLGAPFRSFTLVPDSNPFESLRSALHGAGFSQSQTELLSTADPAAPLKAVQALKRKEDQWLIFVDQFEEIFTVTEEGLRPKFIEALLRIAKDPEGSTKLVLSMRADFLDRFSTFPEFAKAIEKNIDFVAEMQEDELRLAIEQPAAQHGVVFEKGLVEEIIKNVQGQAGSLPLLQYTLDLLWKEELGRDGLASRHLHADTYRTLGGVRGALQKRAEQLYKVLGNPKDEKSITVKQEAARRIFLRLVDLARMSADEAVWRPVRRRIARNSFVKAEEQEILKLLIKDRLLVGNLMEKEEKEATVEVAHEALFTSWERLKQWIEGGKEVIIARNRLSDDSKKWQERETTGDASAAEELFIGSRLGQALDMRTKGDFETILGGLTPSETHFLNASAAQRERRRQEELDRQQKELEKERQLRETESARSLEREQAQQRELEQQKQLHEAEAVRAVEREQAQQSELDKEKRLREIEAARAKEREQAAVVAKQQSKRSNILAAAATVAALIAAFFYYRASSDRAVAERNALLSQAQALVAQARQAKTASPIKSLILAAAAVETTRQRLPEHFILPSAHQALQDTLANTGGRPLVGHEGAITSLAIGSDNHWLVTGSEDRTARLWDLSASDPSAKPIVLKGHIGSVTSVAISPDNHWLATGSDDDTARLWDLRASDPSAHPIVLKGHTGSVTAVAFSSDNDWLVTGSWDTTARLWDLRASDPSAKPIVLRGHTKAVLTVAFSRNNRWLATGSDDDTACVWYVSRNDLPIKPIILKGHESSVTSVVFHPTLHWLATGSIDETAQLWDLTISPPKPTIIKDHLRAISTVAFSADGFLLVTGSDDKTARLWEWYPRLGNRFTNPTILKGHNSGVTSVAFSSDKHWLVTGGKDKEGRLWDLDSVDPSDEPIVLKGHDETVTSVAFGSDSHWLATGSGDRSARLWNLKETDPVAPKGFGGAFNIAWVRDLTSEDLLNLARRTAGRNLSTNEWQASLPGQPYFEVFPGLPIPKD